MAVYTLLSDQPYDRVLPLSDHLHGKPVRKNAMHTPHYKRLSPLSGHANRQPRGTAQRNVYYIIRKFCCYEESAASNTESQTRRKTDNLHDDGQIVANTYHTTACSNSGLPISKLVFIVVSCMTMGKEDRGAV